MLLAAATVSALTAYGRAAALPSADPAGVYDRLHEPECQYNAYVGLFATPTRFVR